MFHFYFWVRLIIWQATSAFIHHSKNIFNNASLNSIEYRELKSKKASLKCFFEKKIIWCIYSLPFFNNFNTIVERIILNNICYLCEVEFIIWCKIYLTSLWRIEIFFLIWVLLIILKMSLLSENQLQYCFEMII